MADCGVASRRKCEQLIEEGKVKVNGHVATIGSKVNPKKDLVTVRGKKSAERKVCVILCSISRADMSQRCPMSSAERP